MFNLHIDRPFLPERKTNLKCNKFVCNIYDKENYIVHLRVLRQALIHGFTILKKVHRIIQFNQEAWRKPYIDMKTKLNNFEKYFFKRFFFFLNNVNFGKTMEDVRKHRDIKLVTIVKDEIN